jgi:hypothetical protein
MGAPIFVRTLSMEERMALEKNCRTGPLPLMPPPHLVGRGIAKLDLAQLCRKERLIFWQVMQ